MIQLLLIEGDEDEEKLRNQRLREKSEIEVDIRDWCGGDERPELVLLR